MDNLFNYITYHIRVMGNRNTVVHLPWSYAKEIHDRLFQNSSMTGLFAYFFSMYPEHVNKIIFENSLMTLSATREDIVAELDEMKDT